VLIERILGNALANRHTLCEKHAASPSNRLHPMALSAIGKGRTKVSHQMHMLSYFIACARPVCIDMCVIEPKSSCCKQ
jgi:hypothetical protein